MTSYARLRLYRTVPNPRSKKTKAPASRWPTGTSYEDVFDYERELREEAERKLSERIRKIEDRLALIEDVEKFEEDYPTLREAYDKFREEEQKMLTFETLKKSGDNGDNDIF